MATGDTAAGLSPRVRGNPRRKAYIPARKGSIPACAGEPEAGSGWGMTTGVYPRVCGGTLASGYTSPQYRGLSPRVRGNPARKGKTAAANGSIPACAGEPSGWTAAGRGQSVYPRVCGGTMVQSVALATAVGLSPRVRGNHQSPARSGMRDRSIPACAGEPHTLPEIVRRGEVYPRVCGGTRVGLRLAVGSNGLSPRVRGNLPLYDPAQDAIRSIPACAGEPMNAVATQKFFGVYPRVCGGTEGGGAGNIVGNGLSPRVRGNRRVVVTAAVMRRSIPACAGEPSARTGV